jgi:hypothetical protein
MLSPTGGDQMDSKRIDADGLRGVAFWTVFLLVTGFTATHESWYDLWPLKEKIDLWVALGTGGLALASLGSVWASVTIARAEERRHQQSLAPFIRIQLQTSSDDPPKMLGLEAQNVGRGPALHIDVRVEYSGGAGRKLVLHDHVSALASHEIRRVNNNETRRPRPMNRAFYGAIAVRYEDMFGNRYGTFYTDFGRLRYEYFGPGQLR